MFEDMLVYQPGDLLLRRFSELLAADLDDDAQRFYARTAADVAAVGTVARRSGQAAGAAQALLEALVSAPAAQPACWRRLYRQIAALTAGLAPDPAGARSGSALGRLQEFLVENVDLADPVAIEMLEHMMVGSNAGA